MECIGWLKYTMNSNAIRHRHSGNPIFSRGEAGAWDEGAIWFTTVERINGEYFLWYEGYGGGTARTEPYGSYLKGGKSQIGLTTLETDSFFVKSG